ncbi:hypothetical protein [Hyphococcus sp. DH-69]|uniref:hypothetical protein n=1 Tax=Hyphococcus formosus TaxID=3143534 RepID=UPI00398AB83F
MRNIEAMFGGVLALVVLGIAFYAMMNANLGSGGKLADAPTSNVIVSKSASGSDMTPTLTANGGQDLVCECYDAAFALAAKIDVLSPEYRTGFQQCRARGGVDAGDAWTAGWNARLSGRPYEASCKAYKRRR